MTRRPLINLFWKYTLFALQSHYWNFERILQVAIQSILMMMIIIIVCGTAVGLGC